MAACRISYDDKGVATVVDEQGRPSRLYAQVLDVTENQDVAINVWSAAVHPDSGLRGEDTSIRELLRFMDSTAAIEADLSPSELSMIKDTMARNGFRTLSELNQELVRLFKPEGVIQLPEIDFSGKDLYTQDDLRAIDLEEVSQIMHKIEGHLLKTDEVHAEPYDQEDLYLDTSKKNILGMSEKLNQSEVSTILLNNIQDFSNEQEIEYAIKASPFTKFSARFSEDAIFRQAVLNDFKDLRRIPTLALVAGVLTDRNAGHYTTIKNTLLSNLSTTELEAEMEYLASISNYVWGTNPEAARGVLKEIEKTLASMNIDVIGISNHTASKEAIIDILNEAVLMIKNPTHNNIASFTDKLQQLIPQEPSSIVELIDERYEGFNIVHLEAAGTETELFNAHGLIKIGEDLYHKVDQEAELDTILDFLAKRYVEGDYEIPAEFVVNKDMTDKKAVLEDISSFIAAQKEILGLDNRMLYTAYKEAFGHIEQEIAVQEARGLPLIQTDESYLKTSFVTDFYNYILEEKIKDSPLYHSTLSNFIITDKDISLKGRPVSIKGIEFEQELVDYIKLKRGNRMRYLIEDLTTDPTIEDLVVINFPETVPELTGEYMMHGTKNVVLPNSPRMYVKIDGNLFRKAGVNDHSDIFSLIKTQPDSTYLTNNIDFTLDKSEVIKELNFHQSLETPTELVEEAKPLEEVEEEGIVTESPKKPLFGQNKNIEDYSTILDSRVKLIDLYKEEEKQQIVNKLDECGG